MPVAPLLESLQVPVDTAEWLVHVAVERAFLVAALAVLPQQELDLRQRHVAIDAPPGGERPGVEGRETPAKSSSR